MFFSYPQIEIIQINRLEMKMRIDNERGISVRKLGIFDIIQGASEERFLRNIFRRDQNAILTKQFALFIVNIFLNVQEIQSHFC